MAREVSSAPSCGLKDLRHIAGVTASAVLAARLAVAGRYDFFRDELYFIVCGTPRSAMWISLPVVPLVAAASEASRAAAEGNAR